MTKLLAPFLLFLATQAFADTQKELMVVLENAGLHSFEDEKREIKIEGCQMTTFRWRELPNHGWVLWTSFQFDMVDAQLIADKRSPGKKYAYAKLEDGPPEIGFAFYSFTMRDGTLARQERSILREPSKDTQPSPRGDGSTHYFEWRENMLITMKGSDVERRAITFTQSYDKYVRGFCTFSS